MTEESLGYLKKRYKKCLGRNKFYSFKNKLFGENKSLPRSKKYAGRPLLGAEEGAAAIAEGLNSDKPFMACRFGSVELETAAAYLFDCKGDKEALGGVIERGNIYSNAGFFPRGDASKIKRFAKEYLVSAKAVDFIGVWYNPMEDYVIERFADKRAKAGVLRSLEPWYAENKWTKALKEKNVLVIHPYAETIEKQYERREKLFVDRDTLPEFNLLTIKAVQTIAGEKDERFSDWFAALDYMYREAMKTDFDIAIIGCGAYGMPLAAKLKESGKKAVHMGGATQLLFGIKGKRWDEHPVISKLYNDFWVRPSADEIPTRASSVENGCYW